MKNEFRNNDAELRAKYNLDGSDLRKAQLRMTKMLGFIDKVCRDNGIKYWLDSGTLLGARRHGGFIPWDDDTDICMTREDAKKFKDIMLHNNPSNEFVLQCRETDKGYFGPWMVLRDLKTEYIQNSELHKKRKYRGLQVDIFPVEDKYVSVLFVLANKIQSHFIDKPLQRVKNPFLSSILAYPSFYLLHFFIFIFRCVSPRRNSIRKCFATPIVWKKISKQNVFPLDSTITFEGLELMCPHNVDGYLTEQYGNWREIPSKIQTHEVLLKFYF